MYGSEREGLTFKIIISMVIVVLLLMIGISIYKVNNSEILKKENEKIVLKVEGWIENSKTFIIDSEKLEFTLDASGSNTDVDYKVTINCSDDIDIFSDEYHLYPVDSVITGTIKYKETMKEEIVLYIEEDETLEGADDSSASTLTVKVEALQQQKS